VNTSYPPYRHMSLLLLRFPVIWPPTGVTRPPPISDIASGSSCTTSAGQQSLADVMPNFGTTITFRPVKSHPTFRDMTFIAEVYSHCPAAEMPSFYGAEGKSGWKGESHARY